MRINEIVDRILHMCDGTLLSDIKSAPSDIDIYIPQENRNKYGSYLDENGYVLTFFNQYHSIYRKYENGLLYTLDLISDFNVYTKFQPFYKFTSFGSERIGRSLLLHKAIKNFSYNKKIELENYTHENILVLFFADPLNYKIQFIHNFGQRNYWDIPNFFYSLRDHFLWPFFVFFLKLKAYKNLIGTGKTIAFLGPDGAGKSYYVSKLMSAGRTKKQYMGDWFFTFQPIYNYLLKIPSPYNRIVYVFYFLENICRLNYVFFLKSIGYIVLIDRYPGTGKNILQVGFLKRINDLIFTVFKKPTLFIILSAPSQEIYRRKQEMTVDEISSVIISLKRKLEPFNHVVIETSDSDLALNSMLSLIFSYKNGAALV